MKSRGSLAAACVLLLPGCMLASGPSRLPLVAFEPPASPSPVASRDGGDEEWPEHPFSMGLSRDRYSAGLWAWRVHGTSDGPAGGNEAFGARFEWSRFEPRAGEDELPVSGVLVELLRGREESEDRRNVTRAVEGSVWWTSGRIQGAQMDPSGELAGFTTRVDRLLGFRVVHVHEEDGDRTSFLDSDRTAYTLPEFTLGGRLEWSPIRRAVLFGRAEAGLFPLLVVNSFSFEWVLGVRLEPFRGLELEAGWRGLGSAGGALFDSVGFVWRGPYAGVVITF